MIIPRTIIQRDGIPQRALPEELEYLFIINDRIKTIALNQGAALSKQDDYTVINRQEICNVDGQVYIPILTELYNGEIYQYTNEDIYCLYYVMSDNRNKPYEERFEVYHKDKSPLNSDSRWKLVYNVHVVNKRPTIYQLLPSGGWRGKLKQLYKSALVK